MIGKRAGGLAAVLALTLGMAAAARSGPEAAYDSLITAQDIALLMDGESYEQYRASRADMPILQEPVILDGGAYATAQGDVKTQDGLAGEAGVSVIGDEGSQITWRFQLPEAGLYQLRVDYYPVEGKGGSIQRQILVNEKLPFSGAELVQFTRIWVNAAPVEQDPRGNDLRPLQVEAPAWQSVFIGDAEGFTDEPYQFAFQAGENTLTLSAVGEPMAVRRIVLTQQEPLPTYEELQETYRDKGYQKVGESVAVPPIQGEAAAAKSSSTLYPMSDRSSPTTVPYDASLIRMNTIGGSNWKQNGQWITWDFDAPESGLYAITIKYRQNITSGMTVHRSLKLDGAYPCQEMKELRFTYKNDWQNLRVGGDREMLFYLEKGSHTLTLEVSLGSELGKILERIEDSVYQLNLAYRDLLVVIGSTPDPYRDYELEKKAPDALKRLGAMGDTLMGISADLKAYFAGSKGTNSAALDQLIHQLGIVKTDVNAVTKWWTSFKDNIVALSAWELSMKEQPLEIDYILIQSPEAAVPPAKASFWQGVVHEVKAFAASFIVDYTSLGTVYGSDAITVWSLTGMAGRDQTQLLKNMIDNSFTPQYRIPVNIQLVDGGVLLPATLAGQGPDVALHTGGSDPVNYALRHAVSDLTQFGDFEETAAQFHDASLTPFRLDDGVYALPETMSFLVLFYRADVLARLGLEVPRTWPAFIEAVSVIQKNNLNVGLPVDGAGNLLLTYSMFLSQRGGRLYNDDKTATDLYDEKAVAAFQEWTALFSDYKLPVSYNFANRFRTGEMPLALADYSQYNYLSVFAPEIKGLWGFTAVPGTAREDGTVDHTSPVSVSSTILMEQSEKKNDAWTFIKWWLSAGAQQEYGNNLENILGISGRLATANKEAMAQLPWSRRDMGILQAQMAEIQGIPEVAGGYFLSRHINNAFYKVYNGNSNPREVLEEYTQVINNEITNKRKEFGLSVAP